MLLRLVLLQEVSVVVSHGLGCEVDARGPCRDLPGRGWNLEVHRDEHFRFLFRGVSVRVVILFVEVGHGPPLVLSQAISLGVLLALSRIGCWVTSTLLSRRNFCDPTD